MPAWPSSIPFFNAASDMSRSGPEGAVIRTQMDKGPPKVRRRTSATTMFRRGSTSFLSASQVATFEAFFREDLGMGSMRFTACDPLDGLEREFRFVGSYEVKRTGRGFSISATLEILP